MDKLNPSERINLLARKWQDGTISQLEMEEFDRWYANFENVLEINSDEGQAAAERRLYKQIAKKGNIKPKHEFRWSWVVAAAASFFLCMFAGTYYFLQERPRQTTVTILRDITPGGNKAVLTLANGQRIVLTTAKNGQLALQGNTAVIKTADGNISYHHDQETAAVPGSNGVSGTNGLPGQIAASGTVAYNMISTPIGGQYRLILADGTKVWLNAASSIKYPTSFAGKERAVEVTGEAYFEVAHDAAKPFRVRSDHQVVEVLGTHFNVNAYPDEIETTTTLLEGSVKVTGSAGFKVITPGQKAVLHGDYLAVSAADPEEAVAWKNGYFKFNGNLESIMSKVARWYNVSVMYQSRPNASYTFEGEISRQRNLSEILKIMEYTGKVHFSVEGRRIIVNK